MPDQIMMRVDITQLNGLIERMRAIHTKAEFRKVMYRAISRTGSRVRTILKQEVPVDYKAPSSWIGRQVGNPTMSSGAEVGCSIPVAGVRGKIGGTYKATADAGGSRITTGFSGKSGKRTRRAYKVRANIVSSGASVLPSSGEAVHFMVFSGPNKGKVYARLSKERNRIRPAVGIGVPQMPTNRSEAKVQEGIMELLEQRIAHEHEAIVKGYAR